MKIGLFNNIIAAFREVRFGVALHTQKFASNLFVELCKNTLVLRLIFPLINLHFVIEFVIEKINTIYVYYSVPLIAFINMSRNFFRISRD